jgi:hypothetical protein
VVLGVDGISDFDALHSRKFDHEVQLHAWMKVKNRSRPAMEREL